jgi:hypothetical protein
MQSYSIPKYLNKRVSLKFIFCLPSAFVLKPRGIVWNSSIILRMHALFLTYANLLCTSNHACTGFLSANFVGFLNAVENKWEIKLYCIWQYYRKRSYITMLMHVVVSTLSNHGRMTIWQSQIFALNEEIWKVSIPGCIKKGNRTSARYYTWITRRMNNWFSSSERSGF